MSDEPTQSVVKKKAKKKAPLPQQFVVISTDNTAEAVTHTDIVRVVRDRPGCKIFSLGKQIKTILVFPGKEDLVSGQKSEDKILIKYA